MSASIANRVYDEGLIAKLRTRSLSGNIDLWICSSAPATISALGSVGLGYKEGITISAPSGGVCTVSAITGGTVTASDTATHIAIIDDADSSLSTPLIVQELSSSLAVTSGGSFALTTFDIEFDNSGGTGLYVGDRLFHYGLEQLAIDYAAGNIEMWVLNAAVTTYAGAGSAAIGYAGTLLDPGFTIGSPANGDVSGRKIAISSIDDGAATVTDTATHFCIVNTSTEELLVCGTLASSVAITSGDVLTFDDFDIEVPDPA